MLIVNPAHHRRPNTLDFKPPRPNRLIQWIFKGLLPWMFRGMFGGLRVTLAPGSLEALRAIRGQRCLLLPNHPSEWDPCVMFEISRRLGENFFYVAAREVFDYSYGLRGWLFQRLGVYSLVRGSNDRGSFKTTMDILSQNRGRLVIFVEGEISNQNDTLLPLQAGVIQMAMMALNDLYKAVGKDMARVPSLFVCPVAIQYRYDIPGLEAHIEGALERLECSVGISSPSKPPRFERLRALAAIILSESARQLGYVLDPNQPMADTVVALSDFMLAKLEHVVNLPTDRALGALDRIRRIRNTLDRVMGQPHEAELTDYEKRLFEQQKGVLEHFYVGLDRVVNFVAIYDGYLAPDMDAHRTVEFLRRLEREVYGSYRLAPPRTARVQILGPLDLRESLAAFLADKKTLVHTLIRTLETMLYEGLQDLKAESSLPECLGRRL